MSINGNTSSNTAGSESLSLMKQWIFAKISGSSDRDDDFGETSSDQESNGVPKIVISRGSEKSLNRIIQTPPSDKRPHPLTKTWSKNTVTDTFDRTSAPYNTEKPFWRSPYLGDRNSRSNLTATHSLPCTPREVTVANHQHKVNSADARASNISPTSPMFKFSQKHKLFAEYQNGQSYNTSMSSIDSPSICGACGQRKFYGSRELVGFANTTQNSTPMNEKSTGEKRSDMALRRTSSCRMKNERHNPNSEVNFRIMKASSNIDVQKQRTPLVKCKPIKRTGSKEGSRSTISLTRSWSINLDKFKLVRNNSAKSDTCDSRKMSLNDSELHRISTRRKSSLLRLTSMCIDNSSDKDEGSSTDSHQDSFGDEYIEYSPKVTRSNMFTREYPLGEFRSTFESDTIRVPSVYGQMKIMFQFFNGQDELHVTLLKGSNIAMNHIGKLGIYTKVCLMPGKLQPQISKDRHDTHDPVFYEPFVFKMTLGELLDRQLRVKMYSKPGILSFSQPVGEFSISLYPFDLTAVTVIWKDLTKCKGQKDEYDIFDFSPLERASKTTKL